MRSGIELVRPLTPRRQLLQGILYVDRMLSRSFLLDDGDW